MTTFADTEFIAPIAPLVIAPEAPQTRLAPSRAMLKPILAAVDVVTTVAALAVAIVSTQFLAGRVAIDSDRRSLALLALTLPGWPAIYSYQRLYTARYVSRPVEEFRRIVRSCALGLVMLALTAYITKISLSRVLVVMVFLSAVLLLTIERSIARTYFRRMRVRGQLMRPVVVVGDNAEADAITAMLENNAHLGYEVRDVVDCSGRGTDRLAVLSTVRDTLAAVHATGASGVIIAATAVDHETSNRLIRVLTDEGVHVELSSTLVDIAIHRLVVRPLGRMPVMYVQPVQRAGWRAKAKRSLDVAVASLGFLTVSPLLLVAAIAIKLDSRGPILFKQERLGRGGKLFPVLKLRTMVQDAEARLLDLRGDNEADGPLFKMRNDPRVTRVGRLLRKFSIDELPQLWNVIRNDMSMVGPRPALPTEMAEWGADLHGRLRVKPGITGMWQVSGRSNSSFEDYERFDLYYVDNWSLVTDLTIIARTIPSVLFRKGAF
jgi:exopolysaccharide biosynthesis polyprenyl glycosylphosphotransferase